MEAGAIGAGAVELPPVGTSAWRQLFTIVKKDVVSELRTKEMLLSMFLFAVLAMVVFHFAFSVRANTDLTYFTGGMLWVTFIFGALLGLNRSFVHEKDEGCLDGLLLCPVDRVTIFLAKMIGNLVFLLVIQALAVPIFSLFFVKTNYLADLPAFLAVLLLADVGVCAVGTLLATISMNTKARDLLLPIIFLPLIIPVLIAATSATTGIFAQTATSFGSLGAKLGFLAAYDAIFVLAAYGTYDYAIGE